MIFLRLDECVSHRIADAARMIGIPSGVVFETPHDLDEAGLTDVSWIATFAKRGKDKDRRVVFSCDSRLRHNEVERVAAESAGLIVFYAPKFDFWRHLHKRGQAAYIIHWLERMAKIAAAAPHGAQFQLPSNFNTKSNVRQLPSLLSQKARKGGRKPGPKASAKSKQGLI